MSYRQANSLEVFEKMLSNKQNEKPLSIYKDEEQRKTPVFTTQCTFKEVITNLKCTLKIMQKGECVRLTKDVRRNLEGHKTAALVSVKSLENNSKDFFIKPEIPTTSSKTTKFETQCFSATQLIDVIDKAEEGIEESRQIAENNDMTNEFDKSFDIDKLPNNCYQNITSDIIDTCVEYEFLDGNIIMDCDTVIDDKDSQNKVNKKDNVKKNRDIEDENRKEGENVNDFIERILDPGPILNTNTKTISNSQHLVYDLDLFEKFEKTAMPLLMTDEPMVNSQVLGIKSDPETIPEEDSYPEFISDDHFIKSQILGFKVDPEMKSNEIVKPDSGTTSVEYWIKAQVLEVQPYPEFTSDEHSIKSQILGIKSDPEMKLDESVKPDSGTTSVEDWIKSQVLKVQSHPEFMSDEHFIKSQILGIKADPEMKSDENLINSKILGVQPDSELSIFVDSDELSCSPILEFRRNSDENKVAIEELEFDCQIRNRTQMDVVKITEEFLKDEILFSSDEESDYVNKQDELPMTCALETSFYTNESDVLDKNMFVGFQTASNKSIQVSTESFERAKSILDYEELSFQPSVTDLVDKCDNKQQTMVTVEQNNYQDDIMFNNNNLQHHVNTEATTTRDVNLESKPEEMEQDIKHSSLITDSKFPKKESNLQQKLVKQTTELLKANTIVDTDHNEALNDTQFDEIELIANIALKMQDQNRLSTEEKKQNQFIGFTTARNEKINVSETALTKYRNIFRDIDLEVDFNTHDETSVKQCDEANAERPNNKSLSGNNNTTGADNNVIGISTKPEISHSVFNIPKNVGFKTASNKKVIISKKALAQSKKIFQDITDESVNKALAGYEKSATPQAKFKGFQTASKKNIAVPKDTLQKSNTLFKDIFQENNKEVEESSAFKGFQTASNKPVKISERALQKTKDLFKDIEDFDSVAISSDNNNFKGFQTASNKPVKISKTALEKCKNIFKDIDDANDIVTEHIHKQCNKTIFKGFQTAYNKPIKISDDALKMTKNLFHDIDDITENIPIIKDVPKLQTFKGFQTASNKPVVITKDAMIKYKSIFKDIDLSEEFSDNIGTNKINKEFTAQSTSLDDFQTTLKTKVDKEGELIKDSKTKHLEEESPPTKLFMGFQTASKKKVKISEESLAKTRSVFKDIDAAEMNETNIETFKAPKLSGFTSASDKKVLISDKSLEKTKNIFQNIDEDLYQLKRKENSLEVKFSGFVTASKKKVVISDEALTKTKELFKDITDLECENNLEVTNEELRLSKKNCIKEDVIEIDKYFNTQVLNNFDGTLNTEDFKVETPKAVKRSASPILSCPKAKKRKCFQTPYKSSNKTLETPQNIKNKPAEIKNTFEFEANYKKDKKLQLKDLKEIENLSQIDNKRDQNDFLSITFDNLLDTELPAHRNDVTNTKIKMDNLKKLFLESVNKNIVPDGWFEIQTKLILWKLLSYEIRFPKTMKCTCNVTNILNQLKYRYDKELYNVQRPVLRKILEKDDIPSLPMVLCVASIYEDSVSVASIKDHTKPIELDLTDGWYIVRASADKMLSKLIFDGKIVIGTKLFTQGAELLNCEQGKSPWEDTSNVRLKITGNATRRAHWSARLGRHGNAAILTQLSSVKLNGGKIARVRVFVARVYPTLYVEKFEDGSTVTRSERLEQLYQMKYENERQALLEKIYEEVEREMSDEDSQDSNEYTETSKKRKSLDSGSQIAKMMKRSKDPQEFRASLTSSQALLLQSHTIKKSERMLQDIQTRVHSKLLNRNVCNLVKVGVVGNEGATKATLTIWRPNDAILDVMKEGEWIEIMNVIPTGVKFSELQLTAGRQTVFSKCKLPKNINIVTKSLLRSCIEIKDLVKNPTAKIDYNEIDTVGIVIEIDPSIDDFEKCKNRPFQNVYLADLERNMVCVNFWGGLNKFGFENILDTGQVVFGSNLQRRVGNTKKNIPHFRATEFSTFTKTPKNSSVRRKIDEINKCFNQMDKRKYCQECVDLKNKYLTQKYCNENVSPYRSDYNVSRNKMYVESPLANNQHNLLEDFNLTGLDFNSTFRQKDTQDISPERLLRKKKVNEKICKLKMYGDPPPLSPMQIINKSKNAANPFKSPLVSVASVEKNLPNGRIETTNEPVSPVMCMNSTYVKRCNPVKLFFSNNTNDSVDHFAEEFESSPPLSLD